MKIANFLFLILISISINTRSQSNIINKYDEKGRKTGYWKIYHENGNIKAEGTYKVGKTIHSSETLFMRGYITDSEGKLAFKDGLWKEYSNKGLLISEKIYSNIDIKYERNYTKGAGIQIKNNYSTKNKFVINDKLFVENNIFEVEGKVGEVRNISLPIYSFSDDKLFLKTVHSNSFKLISNEYISPHSFAELVFSKKLETGFNNDTIHLNFYNKDSVSLKIVIKSFGYNLSDKDLRKYGDKLPTYITRENKLSFIRTKEFPEIRFYKMSSTLSKSSIEKTQAILTLPLSYENNELDISNLIKGRYLLGTFNYKGTENLYINFIKE